MFAPSGAVWSIDWMLRERPSGEAPAAGPVLIPAWPVRLMQIQIGLVYFFTGLSKLGGDWIDGEAVYWVLNDCTLTRWPYSRLPIPLLACRLMSWGTLVLEIGFPFFVAVGRPWRFVLGGEGGRAMGFRLAFTLPALRPWALLAGLAFHLGILIHTEVGWFSPATVAWYALFLSGEGVRNFVTLRWRAGLRRARRRRINIPARRASKGSDEIPCLRGGLVAARVCYAIF